MVMSTGSSVPGFEARTLEWVASSHSGDLHKPKVFVHLTTCVLRRTFTAEPPRGSPLNIYGNLNPSSGVEMGL